MLIICITFVVLYNSVSWPLHDQVAVHNHNCAVCDTEHSLDILFRIADFPHVSFSHLLQYYLFLLLHQLPIFLIIFKLENHSTYYA